MKTIYTAITFLFIPWILTAQDGALDISFNGDGKFIYENKNADERATDVTLQADGKILIIGPSGFSGYDETHIIRLDIYGNPDPKFGNQGIVETDLGGTQSEGTCIAVQADGKILIAGTTEYQDDRGFGVRRLLDSGQPDLNFGDTSYAFLDFANSNLETHFIGVQPNGKIIVAGSAYSNSLKITIARFMANGMPDYSFGDSAISMLNLPSSVTPAQFVMTPSGGLIGVGYTYVNSQQAFAIVQTTASGDLDASFGSNGLILTSFSGHAEAEGVALQGDGKVVIGGHADVNGDDHFALVRLLSDGTLDQSFGTNGKVTAQIMDGDAYGRAVAILGDGKILLAGDAYGIWNRDFAVARFTTTGKLDNSFSFDGFTTKNMGNGNDYVYDAVLQPNGRLVVVGRTYFEYNSGSSTSSYDFAAARFLGGEPTFGIDDLEASNISVYPNPASSFLNIDVEDPFSDYEIELLDMSGKMYAKQKVRGSTSVDVSAFHSGLYMLRIYKDNVPIGSVKVMVE